MKALTASGKREWLTDRNMKLLLFFVTFISMSIVGMMLNIPPVLDEVGTMANTATLVGYDWTQCVDVMGRYYYKYGMSLLYYPLFLIIKNPYILYKAIMVLHAFMLGFVPVFAYSILRKHLNIENKVSALLMAAAGGLLPSVLLYSLYARADMMLIFLPMPTMYVMLEAYQAGEEGKRRRQICLSALLGFLAVYAYMSHTRGVVAVIAVFMTVGLIQLVIKKKVVRWIPYLASTIGFMLIDLPVSNWFKWQLYGAEGTAHASVESFNFASLKLLFTKSGFLSMVKLVLGWAYNVITSTYGMVLIGAIAAVLILFAVLRKKYGITPKEAIFSLFALLSFLGTFALGCLFFFPFEHRYYIGEAIERSDRLIYGRYTVSAVGLLVLLAVYVLLVRRDVLRIRAKIVAVIGYVGVGVLFIWKAAPYLEGVSGCSRYFISLCTFLEFDSFGTTVDAFSNIVPALTYAGILGFAIFIVLLVLSIKKTKPLQIAFCLTMFAASATIFTINYYNVRYSRDVKLVETTSEPASLLAELQDDIIDEYPYIVKYNSAKAIKHYQFSCLEYVVGSVKTAVADEDNVFIVAKKRKYPKNLYEDDFYHFECFDYENAACDVVFVKGHELAARLEELGYTMIKYNLE